GLGGPRTPAGRRARRAASASDNRTVTKGGGPPEKSVPAWPGQPLRPVRDDGRAIADQSVRHAWAHRLAGRPAPGADLRGRHDRRGGRPFLRGNGSLGQLTALVARTILAGTLDTG